MNPLELFIGLAAPHVCVGCGQEGRVLCPSCALRLKPQPSRCYSCHKASVQSKVCPSCYRRGRISRAFVSATYDDLAKRTLHKLKFERARLAANDIADYLDGQLPIFPDGTLVTFAPTANKRVRARGYDQAELIARVLAKKRKLQFMSTLHRLKSSRQLGSGRVDRFKQLRGAFVARSPNKFENRHILLIDDVLTTGATLEEAARILRTAGARSIDVAVFAQP